jgi:hypothetical protein
MNDCHKPPGANGMGAMRVFLIMALTVLLTSGCSTFSSINTAAKRMVRDIKAPNDDLKKKIAITAFENNTSLIDKASEQRIFNDFIEALNVSCPDNILVKPGDVKYPGDLVKLPTLASGWIDTLALAEIGRRLGFNAIVTGALNDVIKKQERHGFWWFKYTNHFLEIHASVEVYDTLTGAKLLDRNVVHRVDIDVTDDMDMAVPIDLATSITNDILSKVATTMAEWVCSGIVLQPWHGYITSTEAGKVIVASGGVVGIEAGNVFEVFDGSKIFNGSEGQQFFVPGLKMGEIKITSVFPDRAEAVLTSGQNISEGCFISPK